MNLDIEKNTIPLNPSILNIRTLNQCIADGAKAPKLEYIVNQLIEPGIGVIVGKSNIGKTILAIQLMNHISTGTKVFNILTTQKNKVMIIDCEMTDRQIANRYRYSDGDYYNFSQDLLRAKLKINILEKDFLATLINSIRISVKDNDVSFVLIDNLMSIIYDLNKPALVLEFMLGIKKLQEDTSISILLIAHPRKGIDLTEKMDLEDVYGSSYIGNFLDYAIGLRKSRLNPSEILLKLLKTRMDVNSFNEDNIIVLGLGNKMGVPMFEFIRYDAEDVHLKSNPVIIMNDDEKMISELEIIKNCKLLKIPNTTIAKILNINEKTVRNKLKLLGAESNINPTNSESVH